MFLATVGTRSCFDFNARGIMILQNYVMICFLSTEFHYQVHHKSCPKHFLIVHKQEAVD